jgi:predicted nucleotidyltransferase
VDDADATLGFGIENVNHELDVLFGRRVDLVARGALHPRMRDQVQVQAQAQAQARVLYAA